MAISKNISVVTVLLVVKLFIALGSVEISTIIQTGVLQIKFCTDKFAGKRFCQPYTSFKLTKPFAFYIMGRRKNSTLFDGA